MTLNDNELPMTGEWASIFSLEPKESLYAAAAVLGGILNDPACFRRIAASLPDKSSIPRQQLKTIVDEVAKKHRLTLDQLLGKSHKYRYSHPRQEVMYRAFVECPHISYPEMGRRLGRDHTTCLHGVRAHCARNNIPYSEAVALRAQRLKRARDFQDSLS